MLMAQLHGKIPEELRYSEDLVTSGVFGTIKNLPATVAARLLALARPIDGDTPLGLAGPIHWSFWPRWPTCEPDVVLDNVSSVLVVEVKLLAGFGSDLGAGTQLHREWHDAAGAAGGRSVRLLTVTADAGCPERSIRDQLAMTDVNLAHVYWLGWLDIVRFLEGLTDPESDGWRQDLLRLLEWVGLALFGGFGAQFDEILKCGVHVTQAPWLLPIKWAGPRGRTGSGSGPGHEDGWDGFAGILHQAADCARTGGTANWNPTF